MFTVETLQQGGPISWPEVQTVSIRGTDLAGTFYLGFQGVWTSSLSVNASAAGAW